MRRAIFWLTASLLLLGTLVCASLAHAGHWEQRCVGGQCQQFWVADYSWKTFPSDPDRDYLFDGDVQVGAWCYRNCEWRAYTATTGTWGAPQDVAPLQVLGRPGRTSPKETIRQPLPKPDTVAPRIPDLIPKPTFTPRLPTTPIKFGDEPPVQNHGLDVSKIKAYCADGHCKYLMNGKEVTREEAFNAMAAGSLTDDSDFLRITWVGNSSVADRLRRDIDAGPLAAICQGQCLFQAYAPDAPMLKGSDGVPLGYEPETLYVMTPTGKGLHRQHGYDSADKLAKAISVAQLRRKDPSFDPKKIPDLSAPEPIPAPKPIDPKTPDAPDVKKPDPTTFDLKHILCALGGCIVWWFIASIKNGLKSTVKGN